MKAFLLSVSVWILSVLSIAAATPDGVRRYDFTFTSDKGALTGIMIVNHTDDSVTGSMINQFGLSALDFRYDKSSKKVQLLSVVSFLDKWYIKRVLREDIAYFLHVLYDTPYKKKHSYKMSRTVDSFTIENTRRHLTYTFCAQPNKPTEDDTEQ